MIEMRHFRCFLNRSYFEIYWKYWKRKKLREKMCYFPLCCVRIGPKSNHQQSLSPIFFSNGQETPMMTRFSFLSDGKFSRFSKSLFSQKAPIFLWKKNCVFHQLKIASSSSLALLLNDVNPFGLIF